MSPGRVAGSRGSVSRTRPTGAIGGPAIRWTLSRPPPVSGRPGWVVVGSGGVGVAWVGGWWWLDADGDRAAAVRGRPSLQDRLSPCRGGADQLREPVPPDGPGQRRRGLGGGAAPGLCLWGASPGRLRPAPECHPAGAGRADVPVASRG